MSPKTLCAALVLATACGGEPDEIDIIDCEERAAREASRRAEVHLDDAPERDREQHRAALAAQLRPALRAGCPARAERTASIDPPLPAAPPPLAQPAAEVAP